MRPSRWILNFAAACALAMLGFPFAILAFTTRRPAFALSTGDARALAVSIGYTACACVLIVLLGTPPAYVLARRRFRGKMLIETVVLLPLLAPPLAMGILLSMAYGPSSAVGHWAAWIGIGLTNTPAAFILAQAYAAGPYYIVAARMAFAHVPRDMEDVAVTMGLSPWQVFWRVTVPMARVGLATAVSLAWVRALGELGIALIIAYFPQGVPIKLLVNLNDFGLRGVYPLLWLFLLAALPVPIVLLLISRIVESNG